MTEYEYLAARAEGYADGYAEGYAAALPKAPTETTTNELIRQCRANLDEWLMSERKKAHNAGDHDLQRVVEACQAATMP